MLLGIISDIHADHTSLMVALHQLVRMGVDKIVCLGDVVEKGTDGNACAKTLQDWLIPCVMGNHDEIAKENQHFDLFDDDPRWHRLTNATLAYLDALPLYRRYLWDNQRVLMCHGSPQNAWEYLHPDMATDKRFKQVADQWDADFILCGHTHRPMDVMCHGVRFLNPGSVCGRYSSGSSTYGTLNLTNQQFNIHRLRK